MEYDLRPLGDEERIQESRTVAEAVYARLKEAILSDQLRPGTYLLEVHLAKSLGVSRTPVRQAMDTLESERLVRRLPNSRRVVAEPTRRELAEIYEVRVALESLAARLVAERATSLELQELMELCAEMQSCLVKKDTRRLAQINADFHTAIAELSRNSYLSSFISILRNATARHVESGLFVPGRANRVVAQHMGIAEAVSARQADRASNAMEEHLIETLQFRRTQ